MTVVVKNTWLQNTVLGTRRIIHSAGDLYRTFSNNFSRYKTTLPTYDARAMPATQDSFTTTPHKKSHWSDACVVP